MNIIVVAVEQSHLIFVVVCVTIKSFSWVPTAQAVEEAAAAMDNNDGDPVTQYEDSLGSLILHCAPVKSLQWTAGIL